MVLHESAERPAAGSPWSALRTIVVILGVEDMAQFCGGVVAVLDDVDVIELDAGLHHQRDDPHQTCSRPTAENAARCAEMVRRPGRQASA